MGTSGASLRSGPPGAGAGGPLGGIPVAGDLLNVGEACFLLLYLQQWGQLRGDTEGT